MRPMAYDYWDNTAMKIVRGRDGVFEEWFEIFSNLDSNDERTLPNFHCKNS